MSIIELLLVAVGIVVTWYFARSVARIEKSNSKRADDEYKPV